MYQEIASMIYDNFFLTDYAKTQKVYIILAKPDDEYIQEVKDDFKPTKETLVEDTVKSLAEDVGTIKELLFLQQDENRKLREQLNSIV